MAENHTAGQIRDLKASPLDLNIYRPEEPAGELENQNLWSRPLARKWTVMLFLGTCLLYCARMTTPVCAVSMAATFHWSKIDSGLVLGGFFWGYCFTQILGGHVSDKVGGERVLFFSAASWALITAGTPVLAHLGPHALALMTGARILMGLLQGVFFPSLASLCSRRVVEAERGFLMSTLHSGSHLGTLLAGGMGSVMLDWYGWESMFYCTGFLAGLWAVTVKCFLLRGDVTVKRMEKKSEIRSSLSRKRWLHLFKKPPVWAMVFAHMCTCSTSYTLLSWLPMFFTESFPHATPWVYNVVPWLIAIPSGLGGGFVSDFLIAKGYKVASVRKIMQRCVMLLILVLIRCHHRTSITDTVWRHGSLQHVYSASVWIRLLHVCCRLHLCCRRFLHLHRRRCVCECAGSHSILRWSALWVYEHDGSLNGSGSGVVLGLPDRGHPVVVRRLLPRHFGKRHRPWRLPHLWRRSTCRPAGQRPAHRGLNHPQLL